MKKKNIVILVAIIGVASAIRLYVVQKAAESTAMVVPATEEVSGTFNPTVSFAK